MTSSRTTARAAVLLGALGVLAVPLSVVAAQAMKGVTLLQALYYAVPTAIVFGLVALVSARRARLTAQRSVFAERRGPVRAARFLAWLGVYAGVTAAIALAVYWVLRARH
jgi:hypothetical protein